VQDSWDRVKSSGKETEMVSGFYEKLFEDKVIEQLFQKRQVSMEQQKCKLFKAFSYILENLSDPEKVLPTLQQLAKSHVVSIIYYYLL
jgi:hemoglobin-like flavoprotein